MSVSTSDLVGLMLVCVPILLLTVYSVQFSKKNLGSSEGTRSEKPKRPTFFKLGRGLQRRLNDGHAEGMNRLK